MMNQNPDDIIRSLQHSEGLNLRPLLNLLRNNRPLLDAVCARAQEQGLLLDPINHLLLEDIAAQLIQSYRSCDDLETGLWLLPELETPNNVDAAGGAMQLNALAKRLERCADAGAVAQALGEDYGFSGDQRNYHLPSNCFLNQCLERRLGMPITLVCLWLLICRRLNLKAWALALPGHVFGAWESGYVDCFNAGKAVTLDDLNRVARSSGNNDASAYLRPCEDYRLLQRCALNTAVGYRQRGDALRALVATGMASRPLPPMGGGESPD